MEPQVSIALPQKEHNEMEIISSTQWPTFAQVFLSNGTNLYYLYVYNSALPLSSP